MSGSVPSLLHMSPWLAKRQLYLHTWIYLTTVFSIEKVDLVVSRKLFIIFQTFFECRSKIKKTELPQVGLTCGYTDLL